MRLRYVLGMAMSVCGAAHGQERQPEVARLAALASIDLSHGHWQHEDVAVCPAFRHHGFVRYYRNAEPGVRSSFMVVSGPVGEPLRLVPWVGELPPGTKQSGLPVAARPATIAAFDAVWAAELGSSKRIAGLSWGGLADCYARFAGEQPVVSRDAEQPQPDMELDERLKGLLVPVATTDGTVRAVAIGVDGHGMLKRAEVTVQGAPQRMKLSPHIRTETMKVPE